MHRKDPRQQNKYRYNIIVWDLKTNLEVSFLCNTPNEAIKGTDFAMVKLKEKEREWPTKNSRL